MVTWPRLKQRLPGQHPKRRNGTDRRRSPRRWRDRAPGWIDRGCALLAVVFLLYAMQAVQSGRRTSLRIVCASNSAVIDAGRSVITGGAPKPGAPMTEFERNLRRLGYPPRNVRRRDAERAAVLYSHQIAAAIERAIHVKGVVRPDGTLDCNQLARVSNAK